MLLTNKHNLPGAIVNAVSAYNYPPKEGRYSVTDLISPPQIRQLKIKYWKEIEEDVSGRLWALLGQACHTVLNKSKPEDALAEEKLVIEFEGVTISGKSDLYHEGSLEDYKITSVYSFLLENGKSKKEWAEQLNVYAWMFTRLGKPVKELWIRAILRDFQVSKAGTDTNYPLIPFQSVQAPLWTLEGQERYIRARLEAHKALNPTCSGEERWLRVSSWAVMKNDNKRAFRVFDNKEQAENLAKTDKAFSVAERKESYNRCMSYCPVSNFCSQWGKVKKETEAI